jgi:hypothetical protein
VAGDQATVGPGSMRHLASDYGGDSSSKTPPTTPLTSAARPREASRPPGRRELSAASLACTGSTPPGVNAVMSRHLAGTKAGALTITAMIAAAMMADPGVTTVSPAPASANADDPGAIPGSTAPDIRGGDVTATPGEK